MTEIPPASEPLIKDMSKAGLKKLVFDHNGRVGRKEYWLFMLFAFIYAIILQVIMAVVIGGAMATGSGGMGVVGGLLTILLCIPVIWGSVIIQIKRLHDLNQVGWLVLINFIPWIGGLAMLVWLGFFPGTQGPNKFGLPKSGC